MTQFLAHSLCELQFPRYRRSYSSSHVLLNLLNKLGKRDHMPGYAEHFSSTARSATYALPFRSCHTALKFSRSPYLDNHLSESIHARTIDTL